MKWEAVFFDFDGVILDSVEVKTKAFAEMFRDYGTEIEKAVVEYHINNSGVSRFKKFRYYYENILQIPIDKEKIGELAQKFSDLVLEKVVNSPFIPGALETLNQLAEENIPVYIVTGTPCDEIKVIVEKKNLSHLVRGTHGSPKEKDDIIKDILTRNGYQNERCMLIGDAMTDYKAAQKTGVCFLGIVKEGRLSIFPEGTTVSSYVTISSLPPLS